MSNIEYHKCAECKTTQPHKWNYVNFFGDISDSETSLEDEEYVLFCMACNSINFEEIG